MLFFFVLQHGVTETQSYTENICASISAAAMRPTPSNRKIRKIQDQREFRVLYLRIFLFDGAPTAQNRRSDVFSVLLSDSASPCWNTQKSVVYL